ncbi:hypothetical protein [Protofrankia symbiont of Coriaria ruscifolia]|nr:hypothetical protein [Protofrankia symbiont of Coriaria ruscifolia]
MPTATWGYGACVLRDERDRARVPGRACGLIRAGRLLPAIYRPAHA